MHFFVGDLERHVAASFSQATVLCQVTLRSSLLLFKKKVFPFFLVR